MRGEAWSGLVLFRVPAWKPEALGNRWGVTLGFPIVGRPYQRP